MFALSEANTLGEKKIKPGLKLTTFRKLSAADCLFLEACGVEPRQEIIGLKEGRAPGYICMRAEN